MFFFPRLNITSIGDSGLTSVKMSIDSCVQNGPQTSVCFDQRAEGFTTAAFNKSYCGIVESDGRTGEERADCESRDGVDVLPGNSSIFHLLSLLVAVAAEQLEPWGGK